MGFSSDSTNTIKLEEHLRNAIPDTPNIMYDLAHSSFRENSPIEIVVELPAFLDYDILIGHVERWREIQQQMNKDIRIYAWCFNNEVEKHVLGCVQHMSHIHVTTLPHWLREEFSYDE